MLDNISANDLSKLLPFFRLFIYYVGTPSIA